MGQRRPTPFERFCPFRLAFCSFTPVADTVQILLSTERTGCIFMVTTVRPHHEVIREVLRYFLRHPQAAADLEGIARWRLLDERVHRKVEETCLALHWLVTHGFLIKTACPGDRPIFSLNPEHIPDAESFLTDTGASGSWPKKQ